jgi:hypothetical protein
MIKDARVFAEVRQDWQGVRNRQTSIFVGLVASRGVVGGIFPHRVADISYSLVLIFAYSVLKDLLLQLGKEGLFILPNRTFLGDLMHSSKTQLPWVNFN